MMDGGSIELLSDTGNVLVVLRLSNPAAEDAVGGELEFNKIAEADAVAYGKATSARILARDGSEVFACDVGDLQSDAVIKLNPVQITRDAPVRIDSFRDHDASHDRGLDGRRSLHRSSLGGGNRSGSSLRKRSRLRFSTNRFL
jgi:hypothetical protein